MRPTVPPLTQGGNTQTDDDEFWNALGDRAIHPVRVEIIEALRWIGRAVPTPDLLVVLGCKHVGLHVEHHLRQLTRLNIVEAGKREGLIRSYRLAGRLRS